MTFPTPKGYISIPDAVDRVSRALHGEPETIPWRGKDLDQAALDSGRKQTTEAQKWLLAELSSGRLVAEIDNFEVPAEYWTCYGAHTTAHTGLLQPPEINTKDYAKIEYQPCFIERSAFEEQLSEISSQPVPAVQRLITKAEIQACYMQHVKDTRKAKGQAPTVLEDEAWRNANGVTRERLRELRSDNRTPEEKKGGAPPRK